jgi:hypothetical protein
VQPVAIKHDAKLRRLLAASENLVFNRAGLRFRKCNNADRQMGMFSKMKKNAFDNLCCLDRIVSSAAASVNSGHDDQLNANIGAMDVGAREGDQLTVIEAVV